jgi:PAS domain S-box-containing protein
MLQKAKTVFSRIPSGIRRYGFAVLSVSIALGLSLFFFNHKIESVAFPLFLMAIVLTVWYADVGPAILALVLAALAFNYYFTEPYYSFYVTWREIPYYVLFILFASLITWFAAIRRRVERNLLQSRDELQREVAIRTQQASLLNLTHDSIFVRDMYAVITYWNRGAQELYGWTAEQAIGKRTDELLSTVFPKPFPEIMDDLLVTDRWEGELEKKKSDGTMVQVASRWALQRDENKNPVAILESENDITDRKLREEHVRKLNQELSRRSSELEGTNKELEAFAYSISHDLRAPLRHMVGFTELLQKHSSATMDDKGRRYMMMVLDAAKRMGNLIDDLLAFSRIGRAETRETMVSMEQLVKEVQNEVWQDTEGRNMNWKIGQLPDLYGDRSMLKLALVNLISNAVKFTRTRTEPAIEIGSTNKQNDEVTIFVKDNGVGFDMRYVNKLFGVFQRLHRADEFEGTGIGLATVKRIIHRHGGEVWAEGHLGDGATFYLSLPKP